jgi:hypothetical protein
VAGYAVNPSALEEIPWIPFLKPQRGDGTLELNDVTLHRNFARFAGGLFNSDSARVIKR